MSESKYTWLNVVKGIFAVIVMFGAAFTLINFIDWRVDIRINDSEYIEKVASQIRPGLVFNSRGTILYDLGGLKYIEDIEVVPSGGDWVAPKQIIIKPKAFLSQAPILTALDSVFIKVTPRRGTGIEWVYDIEQSGQLGGHDIMRFRLEIVYKK